MEDPHVFFCISRGLLEGEVHEVFPPVYAVALTWGWFQKHVSALPSSAIILHQSSLHRTEHRVEAGVLRAIHLGKIQISEIETRGEAALLTQKLFQFEFGI